MARVKNKPVSAHLRRQETQTSPVEAHYNALGVVFNDDETAILYRDWSAHSLTQVVRFKLFKEAPALVMPCAAFLLDRGGQARPKTRYAYIKKLTYLSRFISAYGSSYGIRITEYTDFSTRFMEEFKKWLRGQGDVRPRVNENGGVGKLTTGDAYKLVRDLIQWIAGDKRYSMLAPRGISFDLNPSDGGYKDIKPRKGLSEADLKAIRRACFAELRTTTEKLERGLSVLQDDSIVVPDLTSRPNAFADFNVCLRAYRSVENLLLSPETLEAQYPGLKRALRSPYNPVGDVREHIHFTTRTIVPVVILLGMYFGFEPDTLLLLDWTGETDSQLYGAARGVVTGVKYRGGMQEKSKPYARIDKTEFSPAALFEILRKTTKGTAKLISPDCEKVFCFIRKEGTFGFFRDSGDFKSPLKRFIKDHNLPSFTLSSLRKTGGNLVGKLTGGDVAAQKQHQQHKTVNTTLKSYQDESNLERRADKLAELMNVRARRLKNRGRIDTRGGGLPIERKLAATMGFQCLDPYDSPLENQIPGQLCQAYAQCPACPLAIVDRLNSHDFYRLQQLRTRLSEARTTADPSRWRYRWLPQLTALDRDWLPAFPAEVRQKASGMALPPIPEVD